MSTRTLKRHLHRIKLSHLREAAKEMRQVSTAYYHHG